MTGDAGKGDTPRPKSVPADEYARRWDRVFRDIVRKPADTPHEEAA